MKGIDIYKFYLYNIIVEVSIKEVNINMSFWRAYFNTKNSILAY